MEWCFSNLLIMLFYYFQSLRNAEALSVPFNKWITHKLFLLPLFSSLCLHISFRRSFLFLFLFLLSGHQASNIVQSIVQETQSSLWQQKGGPEVLYLTLETISIYVLYVSEDFSYFSLFFRANGSKATAAIKGTRICSALGNCCM